MSSETFRTEENLPLTEQSIHFSEALEETAPRLFRIRRMIAQLTVCIEQDEEEQQLLFRRYSGPSSQEYQRLLQKMQREKNELNLLKAEFKEELRKIASRARERSVKLVTTEAVVPSQETKSKEEPSIDLWTGEEALVISLPGCRGLVLPAPEQLKKALENIPPPRKKYILALMKVLGSYYYALPNGDDPSRGKRFKGQQSSRVFLPNGKKIRNWAADLGFQFGKHHSMKPIEVLKHWYSRPEGQANQARIKKGRSVKKHQTELKRAQMALGAMITMLQGYHQGEDLDPHEILLSDWLTIDQERLLMSSGDQQKASPLLSELDRLQKMEKARRGMIKLLFKQQEQPDGDQVERQLREEQVLYLESEEKPLRMQIEDLHLQLRQILEGKLDTAKTCEKAQG